MGTAWVLLAVPGTCLLLTLILLMSAVAERRFLSPRSLIRGAVRGRSTPEFAEAFVARQLETLLGEDSSR